MWHWGEAGGVLKRSLMRRVAAVVYYYNMLKAFGDQTVDNAAELLIRIERGQDDRQLLPDIVFFVQCDYLLVGELELIGVEAHDAHVAEVAADVLDDDLVVERVVMVAVRRVGGDVRGEVAEVVAAAEADDAVERDGVEHVIRDVRPVEAVLHQLETVIKLRAGLEVAGEAVHAVGRVDGAALVALVALREALHEAVQRGGLRVGAGDEELGIVLVVVMVTSLPFGSVMTGSMMPMMSSNL